MPIRTITSRDFNQNSSGAKKASRDGPVIITVRGHPAHVLLSYADYETLKQPQKSVAEVFAMPEGANVDIEFQRIDGPLREIDLS